MVVCRKINDHLVGRDSCSFESLLDGRHTRKSVAAAFYNVLGISSPKLFDAHIHVVMACTGSIKVRQEEAYGKIVLC